MRCYGNASKRKRLNTETDPKVTMGPFPFFYELSEIPQKLKSVEGFLNIFDRFPLYLHLIRFPYFLIGFHIFFGSVLRRFHSTIFATTFSHLLWNTTLAETVELFNQFWSLLLRSNVHHRHISRRFRCLGLMFYCGSNYALYNIQYIVYIKVRSVQCTPLRSQNTRCTWCTLKA